MTYASLAIGQGQISKNQNQNQTKIKTKMPASKNALFNKCLKQCVLLMMALRRLIVSYVPIAMPRHNHQTATRLVRLLALPKMIKTPI